MLSSLYSTLVGLYCALSWGLPHSKYQFADLYFQEGTESADNENKDPKLKHGIQVRDNNCPLLSDLHMFCNRLCQSLTSPALSYVKLIQARSYYLTPDPVLVGRRLLE